MHLYIHIPFCHEICPYCSFYKHKPDVTSHRKFTQALLKELEWQKDKVDLSKIETIYLGGGTPSLLSPTIFRNFMEGLAHRIPFSAQKEITLEANPSTFDLKKARLFKEMGITRVSLGVQSFVPEELKVLGRDHTKEAAIQSFNDLREAEIPSVNIDLMFSTPKQTSASWETSLRQAVTLSPDHISCYNLTYEEDTEYFQKFLDGDYTDEAETNESHFSLADTLLTEAGFDHYETSNYAKDGQKSLHNQGYWNGSEYLGIGPSAVSCLNRERTKNVPDTALYMQRVSQLGNAVHEHETLDDEAWRLERLALELRTTSGCSLTYADASAVDFLIEQGLLNKTETHFMTTKKGACLVDSIVEYLA